jgi:membrane peptidoglycan carboxypeptidase
MSRAHNLIQINRRKRRHTRRNSGLRVGLSCGLILCFLFFLSSISIAWLYSNITEGLPSPEELPALLEPTSGRLLTPTKIYDRSGSNLLVELRNPAINQNVYLTSNTNWLNQQSDKIVYQKIPPILMLTTVAASDAGFWNHAGYSLKGLLTQEHPTIAQRLVNDYLLWGEPSGIRKALRERLLAAQITSLYGRDKILEWFINYADYGNYTYGAANAAKAYFNKDAGNLNLIEAAILAGTAETPLLNPWDAAIIASERGNQILQSMLAKSWISQDQVDQANREAFIFEKPLLASNSIAPDFVDYTMAQLNSKINMERLKRGGFTIFSTLDYNLQAQTVCTVKTQLDQLRGKSELVTAFNGEECTAARLLPTLVGANAGVDRSTMAGVLVMDPQKGEILAMTSDGVNLFANWYSGAYSANTIWQKHSTGTVLTPLIYLTALTRGFTLASLVWDIPPQESLIIPNPDNKFHGPLRLRIALANDYIAPALNVEDQIGIENVNTISKQFGISIDTLANNASAADILINSKASLVEISQFYAAIANQGNQTGWMEINPVENHNSNLVKPIAVLSVEDDLGNILIDNEKQVEEKTVTTPQLAYLLTNALSDKASAYQTLGHPNVLEVGFQTAAKQGKTYSDDASGWTVGYTPELLVGVWTGVDKQENDVSSPVVSSSLWRAIMQYASKTTSPSGWVTPAGITSLKVCDPSGMLPSDNCPDTVEEVFMAGTEPTEADNLFRSLEINKETGLLATVFTPVDFIEKKVFIDFPPDAMSWAISSGLNVAPTSYDIIAPDNSSKKNVAITSPKLFSYVSGLVDIKGSAAGEGFKAYRVQVGKGVNPTQWLQIGDDISTPVFNGSLMQWDTSKLDGLYAVQLTVIQNENRIENTFTQVTVDNHPPEILIAYPADGQKIPRNSNGVLTIQLDVTDNLGINQVEMFIDNKSIATLYQAPYAYSWEAQKGKHTLRILTTDVAGNTAEKEITFSVLP